MTGRIIRPDTLPGWLITAFCALILAGCGSDEDDASDAPPADPASDAAYDVELSGSVGDGPIVDASMVVTASSGEELATFTSDQEASYNVRFKTQGKHYPLLIQANGGIDLVTNTRPDLRLESVLAEPSAKASANLSPFSTLAVATARQMNGGLSTQTLGAALETVMTEFSFGLTSLANEDVVSTPIDDSNLPQMVKASEALTELFRRTNTAMLAADGESSVDDVVTALGADLADGRFDGQGTELTDAHVSATATLVASQVLIESMANRLRVNDQVVTQTLDDVIGQLSDASVTAPTESLPVTARMLANAKLGVDAALAISPSAQLDALRAALDDVSAGMSAANAREALPSDAESGLDEAISRITAGLESDIETVNAVRGGQAAPAPGDSPPTISGTPPTEALAGREYTFTPDASDPDDDPLTFSISGKPAWATFSSSTGTLAGTPDTADVGTFGNIVISVSDGTESAALEAFSITVEEAGPANSAPTISGAPPATVTAGASYAFTPTASDPDGDPLTFSIAGKPAWATFSTSTGRLSGTPDAGAVGTYEGIVISVSDGAAKASLDPFTITVEPGAAPDNTPPTISGTPASEVLAGEAYAFRPSASDTDGDTLTFSITGKPAWATFSATTGRLSGTPTEGDVGTYDDVVISVSDGEATDSLPAFSITVDAIALGSVTLSWTPPTLNTDGTALTDLDGYTVYWGKQSGEYTNSADIGAGATTFVVENLSAGTWYFAMRAYNTQGVESDYSGEASVTID